MISVYARAEKKSILFFIFIITKIKQDYFRANPKNLQTRSKTAQIRFFLPIYFRFTQFGLTHINRQKA